MTRTKSFEMVVRSLSPSSSDSHVTCRLHPATQALTSVVLPKPAGAEISVNLRCRPAFNRSTKRGRSTAFGGGGGMYSFVAKIGVNKLSGALRRQESWLLGTLCAPE